MAWEKRGDNLFYYRKKRVGKSVVSEYIGTGQLAQMFADTEAEKKQERELSRSLEESFTQQFEEIDHELANCSNQLERAATILLKAHGIHQHRGEWRRKRD